MFIALIIDSVPLHHAHGLSCLSQPAEKYQNNKEQMECSLMSSFSVMELVINELEVWCDHSCVFTVALLSPVSPVINISGRPGA